ncbi:MAG: hypothetical protein KatS3mg012_2101 [Gaiellaceae bacterium]|nr:MAG: hypothetical protein KatS3mg012_2101 [Gaiellaceae bacterium]
MTSEQRAARERKQKIFVAVGGVVLIVLLAIQLPKILGGSSGTQTSARPTTSTSTASAATPGSSTPGTPSVRSGEEVALPASEGTKLRAFGLFAKKDPFVQQVVTASDGATSEGSGSAGTKKGAAGGDVTRREFATGGKPSVTVIRVNGAPEPVAPGSAFPAADPVFVLVAEKPRAKAVTIGIAGGAYANGAKTTVLTLGKPVVLENTATGATYRLVLVSVGSGAPAVERTPPASQPGAGATP